MSDPIDPTPLAEQISREHGVMDVFCNSGFECKCGRGMLTIAHVATVTEEAVVGRARDAVARMNITGPMRAIFTDPVYREALDALEVLVDQETQSALHCIDPGQTS